jgi:hypothetical protein
MKTEKLLSLIIAMFFVMSLIVSCKKEIQLNDDTIPVITKDNYGSSLKVIYDRMNKVLEETKPSSMSLVDYRKELLFGKLPLSKDQEDRIMKILSPLAEYGKTVAKNNKMPLGDFSSNVITGGLNVSITSCNCSKPKIQQRGSQKIMSGGGPEAPPADDDDLIVEGSLTWGEVRDCALVGLGVDAL